MTDRKANDMEHAERELLIDILGVALREDADEALVASLKERLTSQAFVALYSLAKRHDLAHIVASVVYRYGIEPPTELAALLQKEEMLSIYRYEQIQFAYAEICEVLEDAGIAYVPLKGVVIRPYYAEESMRTSCDIDILIHEEDMERAVACLEQKNYRSDVRKYHEISLFSPNHVHLELHFMVRENMACSDEILGEAWHYASVAEGCRYEFSKDFFMFYFYAHMAQHFSTGGCGLRPVMDIWVLSNRADLSCSCASELLTRANLNSFAEGMHALAEYCFQGGARTADAFLEKLLGYLLDGGAYGNAENHFAITKSHGKGTFRYVWERLFLPYRYMKILYPVLHRIPILLPFCWVARWFSMLFGGKAKRALSEVTMLTNVSEDKAREIAEIHSRLQL